MCLSLRCVDFNMFSPNRVSGRSDELDDFLVPESFHRGLVDTRDGVAFQSNQSINKITEMLLFWGGGVYKI